jgi:hypothetical protein
MRKELALTMGLVAMALSVAGRCATTDAQTPPSTDGNASSDQFTLPLGPLKFTAGPQSNGTLGATLKGSATDQLDNTPLYISPGCLDPAVREAFCNQFVGALTFDVDAAWSTNIGGTSSSSTNSSAGNKNNATVTFDPSLDWMVWSKNIDHSDAEQAAVRACAKAHEEHPDVPLSPECLAVISGPPAFHHYVVLAAFPDLEYRYGTFNEAGTDYTANQFVYGGGVRALVPTLINGTFANWPYLGISYTNAKNYGASNLPIAAGAQNRYLNINGRIELNIDWLRASHGIGLLALADVTGSHPTASSGGASWQNAKLFQLIIDTGSKTGLKPALTYRNGTDRGMTYDRQVIFGVLWDIWNSK